MKRLLVLSGLFAAALAFAQYIPTGVASGTTTVNGVSCAIGGSCTLTGMTQLATNTLGALTSNFTFSNISGAYNSLELIIQGRSATAAAVDTVDIQLNGDTGNNYGRQFIAAQGAGISANTQTAVAQILTGVIAANSATAGYPGSVTVIFPRYAGATFSKTLLAFSTSPPYSGSPAGTFPVGGSWTQASPAAITSIKAFLDSGANFQPGSSADLYGIN